MEQAVSPRPHHSRVDGHILTHTDHEQAWPGLRQEAVGIDDQRPGPVAGVGKGLADDLEIPSAMRGQGSADILNGHDSRCPVPGGQVARQSPEVVKRAGPPAPEARADAGQGQILTGKRPPHQVRHAGKVCGGQGCDVPHPQSGVTPVGAIGRRLGRIEIIGQQALPALSKAGAHHAATGKELVKAPRRGLPEGRFDHIATLTRAQAEVHRRPRPGKIRCR